MRRRSFLTRSTAGAALLATPASLAAQPENRAADSGPAAGLPRPGAVPARPLVLTPAVAMAPRTDGVELVWAVSRHARGHVEIKTPDGGGTLRGGTDFGYSTQGDKVLRVRLDGLEPGKSWQYRAVTEAVAGPPERHVTEWRQFRTLSGSAAATRFVVWNDTHLRDETLRRLHERTPECDFLVWNGDICNDWVREDLVIPTLLHPAGTDFTAAAPLMPVWGNHDLRGEFGYLLERYAATPSGKSWYAFRSGPVAVVVLNTGEDKPDAHPSFKGRVACEPLRAAQASWLRNHVLTVPELRDAPYRLVICHIPLRWKDESAEGSREYDVFSGRSRALWHGALAEWKAQAVISGHTHQVHWMDGTAEFPYAQLTGGGPQPERATWLEVTADAERLRLRLHPLAGGTSLVEKEFSPLA